MSPRPTFCLSEEGDQRERTTRPFDSGTLRRRGGLFPTALLIVAVLGILLFAAQAGGLSAGPSASSLLAGGRGGINPVGANLTETHRQVAFPSPFQRAPAALLPDNDPGDPSVMATVPVGSEPSGVAYDSAKGEVFVTDSNFFRQPGRGSVSVIQDTTNMVVATVTVGSEPQGAAYDAAKGEVYVANDATSNVSVISDATNSVVATVPVGSGPWGAAYDAATGQVFVTNVVSNNVSVINDKTDMVVATLPVGSSP